MLFEPELDSGQPFILLAHIVLLAKVREDDALLGREKLHGVEHINLPEILQSQRLAEFSYHIHQKPNESLEAAIC
jgi:hypothetical protein